MGNLQNPPNDKLYCRIKMKLIDFIGNLIFHANIIHKKCESQ